MNQRNEFFHVVLPIPVPLKTVNCYLCKTDEGWHIIDTGMHTEEAEEIWRTVFRKLHIDPQRDVVEIVLTHCHPDHFGMAGWLQELTGAPVKISEVDWPIAQLFWYDGREPAIFDDFADKHGMPSAQKDMIYLYLDDFLKYVRPLPDVVTFGEGTVFHWDNDYQAILTPGHADGHMIFYAEAAKTVIAGDLLLQTITPNVGFFPGLDTNPLQSFLNSLQRIQQYDFETVLPGHRMIYHNGNQRAQELIRHHEERLQRVLQVMNEPATANQISEKLFSHLRLKEEPHQARFALAETVSHLVYLEEKGIIGRDTDARGKFVFYKKERLQDHFQRKG